jgi:hypothetical protein
LKRLSLLIGIIIAVVGTLVMAVPALASTPPDQPNITVSWSGSNGGVSGSVGLGDDLGVKFDSGSINYGTSTTGTFEAGYTHPGNDSTGSSFTASTSGYQAGSDYSAWSSNGGSINAQIQSNGTTYTNIDVNTKRDNVSSTSFDISGNGSGTLAKLTAYVGSNSANIGSSLDGWITIQGFLNSSSH